MNTSTTEQPQEEIAIQPDVDPRVLAAMERDQQDRRTGLSEWFKRPEPSDEQLASLQRTHDETKAAHADAKDKLERLSGEVRRFTEALDGPKELESIVAAAQTAEVRARLLDGNVAADEAMKVLKIAQKRFEAALAAAREAEIVLPDVRAMVEEQRKVVEAKKESLRKAAFALGDASSIQMLHRGVRGPLKGLLATIGSLKRLDNEFGSGLPIEIKVELSGIGWFEAHEINADA